jgi:predicted RNase H-like nuclease (RuvC/YqgF family)
MTQPDRSSEPHVSPDELRAALAPRGRSRPSPVVSNVLTEERGERGERDHTPAWEWTTELSDGDQAELLELRATVEAQRTRMDALESELSEFRASTRESREALSAFAAATPWQRRALRREFGERGLL